MWPAPPTQGVGGSPSGEVVGALLLPGDADPSRSRSRDETGWQAEEPELRHPRSRMYQAADIPTGAPGAAQSGYNCTLVCGSRMCFLLRY